MLVSVFLLVSLRHESQKASLLYVPRRVEGSTKSLKYSGSKLRIPCMYHNSTCTPKLLFKNTPKTFHTQIRDF